MYRSAKSTGAFTLIQLIIWVMVVSVVIGGFFYLLNIERAKTRDAKRVSDMTRVQAAFEFLYATKASFRSASEGGCSTAGALVSTCNLGAYLPDIASMRDPGSFTYVVSRVPDDEGYEVTFQLEHSYGAFASGAHVLSPDGIL